MSGGIESRGTESGGTEFGEAESKKPIPEILQVHAALPIIYCGFLYLYLTIRGLKNCKNNGKLHLLTFFRQKMCVLIRNVTPTNSEGNPVHRFVASDIG